MHILYANVVRDYLSGILIKNVHEVQIISLQKKNSIFSKGRLSGVT